MCDTGCRAKMCPLEQPSKAGCFIEAQLIELSSLSPTTHNSRIETLYVAKTSKQNVRCCCTVWCVVPGIVYTTESTNDISVLRKFSYA